MKNKKDLKYYTYTLDMTYLNVLSIIIFVGVWLLVFFINKDYLTPRGNVGLLFIYMILWLMFHEVLHGIGFSIFKEVKTKNVVFGMALEKGVFYCMCKQKISKKVILTSLLFPFTIIGVITLIIGMLYNNYDLIMLSILNIAGAVGDLVMTNYFIKAPKDITYLDLDDCTSFTVLSKEDLSKLKVKGLKLKETGNYSEDMEAKDKRKIVISKQSYIVLGILIILSLFVIFVRR